YRATLAAEAGPGGAVPPALPVIGGYPGAAHWADWTYEPGLNPTAGLVGVLRRLGAEHAWIDEATAWCWSQIEDAELPDEAHALSEVLVFLEHVPERPPAEAAARRVRDRLADAPLVPPRPA